MWCMYVCRFVGVGDFIVSCSRDKLIKLWEVATGYTIIVIVMIIIITLLTHTLCLFAHADTLYDVCLCVCVWVCQFLCAFVFGSRWLGATDRHTP